MTRKLLKVTLKNRNLAKIKQTFTYFRSVLLNVKALVYLLKYYMVNNHIGLKTHLHPFVEEVLFIQLSIQKGFISSDPGVSDPYEVAGLNITSWGTENTFYIEGI